MSQPLLAWPRERVANALRHGLARLAGRSPPQSLIDRLLAELPGASTGRWPAPGGGEFRLHDGTLSHASAAAAVDAPVSAVRLDLRRAGRHALPNRWGTVTVTAVSAGGVSPEALHDVEVRARRGGEQFQAGPDRPARSLKKQYQERRIPAWAREGPLLFDQDRLIFVPGLGLDARCLAEPGRRQMLLSWEPDPVR